MIACGFGYSQTKVELGNDDYAGGIATIEEFNSLRLINIRPIMLATKFADNGTNWNIQIHNWLKYYVMLRLIDRTKPRDKP